MRHMRSLNLKRRESHSFWKTLAKRVVVSMLETTLASVRVASSCMMKASLSVKTLLRACRRLWSRPGKIHLQTETSIAAWWERESHVAASAQCRQAIRLTELASGKSQDVYHLQGSRLLSRTGSLEASACPPSWKKKRAQSRTNLRDSRSSECQALQDSQSSDCRQ